jgi:hypothetical protein
MKAMKKRIHSKGILLFWIASAFVVLNQSAFAETIYVNVRVGKDSNPGTKKAPFQTLNKAAEMIQNRTRPGPTTIKIAPTIYNFSGCVEFYSSHPYTKMDRLVIEAEILPDDPGWKPALMPVLLSTEDPRKDNDLNGLTATYSIKVKLSHVTIRGLKFLGNPLSNNWHCCIERIVEDLNDLVVTQCLFLGDKDTCNIYCAALATGDRFIVDHCIFRRCHACTVYWDGPQSITGKRCSMRYCIVDGAYISGVWTCRTAEDFEFHHNIVTRSEYFWMRERIDNPRTYRAYDCIITDNKNYSGYGIESGPTSRTGPEVSYQERNVIKEGDVSFVVDKRARNYLHPVPGTFGSDLGAGLFNKSKEK